MSRWDGNLKYITKDCGGCQFYRELKDGEEEMKLCGWGVAYKFLVQRERPRKCDLFRREPQGNHSIDRIDGDETVMILKWRRDRAREKINRGYHQLELFS